MSGHPVSPRLRPWDPPQSLSRGAKRPGQDPPAGHQGRFWLFSVGPPCLSNRGAGTDISRTDFQKERREGALGPALREVKDVGLIILPRDETRGPGSYSVRSHRGAGAGGAGPPEAAAPPGPRGGRRANGSHRGGLSGSGGGQKPRGRALAPRATLAGEKGGHAPSFFFLGCGLHVLHTTLREMQAVSLLSSPPSAGSMRPNTKKVLLAQGGANNTGFALRRTWV